MWKSFLLSWGQFTLLFRTSIFLSKVLTIAELVVEKSFEVNNGLEFVETIQHAEDLKVSFRDRYRDAQRSKQPGCFLMIRTIIFFCKELQFTSDLIDTSHPPFGFKGLGSGFQIAYNEWRLVKFWRQCLCLCGNSRSGQGFFESVHLDTYTLVKVVEHYTLAFQSVVHLDPTHIIRFEYLSFELISLGHGSNLGIAHIRVRVLQKKRTFESSASVKQKLFNSIVNLWTCRVILNLIDNIRSSNSEYRSLTTRVEGKLPSPKNLVLKLQLDVVHKTTESI